MGGSQSIPSTRDVISPDGFGNPAALVLTLDAPKQALHYRANLSLDVINSATSPGGEVVLYLDVSVDGGTTFTSSREEHARHQLDHDRGGGTRHLVRRRACLRTIHMELEECL
jgi:hypothetical protein